MLHLIDITEFSSEKQNKILKNKKVNKNRTFIEKELMDLLGAYNKTNIQLNDFLPKTELAIERAKTLDKQPENRWIDGLGTRIYLLVEKLI